MAENPTFTAHMKGSMAETLTLGGMSISNLINGADIYLRAGAAPEVVIRPTLATAVDVELAEVDGKAPRYIVAPDVGVLLTELGWMSPEAVDTVHATLAEAHSRAATVTEDLEATRISLEQAYASLKETRQESDHLAEELAAAATRIAQMEDEQATAQGTIQDLELANGTLNAELEAAKATQDRLSHPYDVTPADALAGTSAT
jgi:exonuclease VII small subunit